MIRVLHAADLHLDSPFQSLGQDKALIRRAEQRGLLDAIADAARTHKADLAVFAGDLFDAEDIFSQTGQAVRRALSGMGIPVFVAPGNHDYYGVRSAWSRLTFGENVHIFTGQRPSCVPLPGLGVRVWGAAFTEKHRGAPLAGFHAEKDGDMLDLMVLHGEVGNPASEYGPIAEADLAGSGMDYVALGHVHAFSGLRRAKDTFYAWPGCPEGRGFDETGPKGVILATLSPGRCEAELIPIARRRYEIARVDLTDAADPVEAVLAALPEDTSRDSYRIRLTGQTETAPDMEALRSALEGRFFTLELRDETSLRRDIWAERGGDSLKGLFLEGLWERLRSAQTEAERERVTRAARWGLLAMENGDEPPMI